MYDEQLHQMSASLAKDSIVTQVLAKFLEQTMEVCAEHEAAAVEAMRLKTMQEVADWMIARSYATGHGDTIADMLGELKWQIDEARRLKTIEECAKIARREIPPMSDLSEYGQGKGTTAEFIADAIAALRAKP